MTIQPTVHSAINTPTPFAYDGKDVKVGDWLGSGLGGSAVRIYAIEAATSTSVTVLVEDVERFNLLSDASQSGVGFGPSGTSYIFPLDDDGMPILGPIQPFDLPVTFQTDMEARFRFRNIAKKYVQVFQPGNDMLVGDVVRPDPDNSGQYIKASADNFVDNIVGIVTSVDAPGIEWFTYKPIGTLVNDVSPPLVGKHGDMFYVNPTAPGQLTNVRPSNNARPIYMRLDSPTRAILVDRNNMDLGETLRYTVDNPVDNQTNYQMPVGATSVLYMSINGIENDNYTFDELTGALTFDPSSTGYGVEASDEVFFVYKS